MLWILDPEQGLVIMSIMLWALWFELPFLLFCITCEVLYLESVLHWKRNLSPWEKYKTKRLFLENVEVLSYAIRGLKHHEVGLQIWQAFFPEIKLEIYTSPNTFSAFHIISLQVAPFYCCLHASCELLLDQTDETFSSSWTDNLQTNCSIDR